MQRKYELLVILMLIFKLLTGFSVSNVFSQDVPVDYKKFFVRFADKRSILEKTLNSVGLTRQDFGRSFALIAGVSKYPNMTFNQELKPAAEDLIKLQEYLINYEFFDEIVVLKNSDVSTENFEYFLQAYFPKRLKKYPKSRFLFAYSGHGMTQGENGYLLRSTARDLSDLDNSINLRVIKVFIDDVIEAGHHNLVLLNSCYAGAFLRRSFGGSDKFIPRHSGAHAITAGGSNEIAWHDPYIGTGSVFFEKFFAGLGGIADSDKDNIITTHELYLYLRKEIQIFTDQNQNPQLGDISKHGCSGEFFFLNREKQVARRSIPQWKPETGTPMGVNAQKLFNKGKEYYDKLNFTRATYYFRQSAEAGNVDALYYLGLMNYGTAKYEAALPWFRKAAGAGHTRGMLFLGLMHKRGLGVNVDYATALWWLVKAANAGNADAMHYLGDMYEEGLGIPTDYNQAEYWHKKAIDFGYKPISNVR